MKIPFDDELKSICPVMMLCHVLDPDLEDNRMDPYCLKDKCEWWIHGEKQCAVEVFGRLFSSWIHKNWEK